MVLCRLERGIFAKSTQESRVPKWQVTSGVESVNDSSPFKAIFSGATANGGRGRFPVEDDTRPRVVFFLLPTEVLRVSSGLNCSPESQYWFVFSFFWKPRLGET